MNNIMLPSSNNQNQPTHFRLLVYGSVMFTMISIGCTIGAVWCYYAKVSSYGWSGFGAVIFGILTVFSGFIAMVLSMFMVTRKNSPILGYAMALISLVCVVICGVSVAMFVN